MSSCPGATPPSNIRQYARVGAANGQRKGVDVAWSATSPVSGRFDAVETRSDVQLLNERFAALRALGHGYLEVRRDTDYPTVSMGFRDSVAVVEAFMSQDAMSVLVGDGSCPGAVVEVPIMDEEAAFSGPAGIDVDRAWSLVQAFLGGRDLADLGEWMDL